MALSHVLVGEGAGVSAARGSGQKIGPSDATNGK
jgi:hypothetical protein